MGEGRGGEQGHLVGSLDQVGRRALRRREARADVARERALQTRRTRARTIRSRASLTRVEVQKLARLFPFPHGKGLGVRFYRDANTSARCRVSIFAPARLNPPPICIRHPQSFATTTSAPLSLIRAILSSSIEAEICGNFTENIPPKPQHSSRSRSSRILIPPTALSSIIGSSRTPNSRIRW